MLIGLCGGICAGKQSVADYLVQEHGFRRIILQQQPSSTRIGNVPGSERSEAELSFSNVEALLETLKTQWSERWVITDLYNQSPMDALFRLPYFLLISIDAPVSIRWQRYQARCNLTPRAVPTLEQFVVDSDKHLYGAGSGLVQLIDRAQVRLLNSSDNLSGLHHSLKSLDLIDEQRLRPSWDQYFMQLASLAAQRSNCMRRRVGCVIVREKRVISTGYNGTPRNIRNCNEGGCPRCNGGHGAGVGLATCLCIHAEENALLEAGRERIREGSTLYCDTCPCLTCSIKITQVGISEVVYSQSYYMDTETAAVFKEAGVQLRQFSPPRNGLVDLGYRLEKPAPGNGA